LSIPYHNRIDKIVNVGQLIAHHLFGRYLPVHALLADMFPRLRDDLRIWIDPMDKAVIIGPQTGQQFRIITPDAHTQSARSMCGFSQLRGRIREETDGRQQPQRDTQYRSLSTGRHTRVSYLVL
jgi:hypothetical protein